MIHAVKSLIWLLFTSFFLVSSFNLSMAAKRVALVIGNSNYQFTSKLVNPVNDASDISAAFAKIGFEVTTLENSSFDNMRKSLRKFSKSAFGADTAIIYYAGHGIEVEKNNYIIPTDAKLASDQDVSFETIPLSLLTESVSGAKGFKLVMLDACRNNPFAASMKITSAGRSIGRGLAKVEPAIGTLVAFAAKEGTIAADGSGRNSPYAQAFLTHIKEPNLEINLLFRKIRDSVLKQTNGVQQPFTYGSLSSRQIYLNPTNSANKPVKVANDKTPNPSEMDFWESVKDANSAAMLKAYVNKFPNGMFVELAELKISELSGNSTNASQLKVSADSKPIKVAKNTLGTNSTETTKSNVAMIIDASGSMAGKLADGTTRMDAAKQAVDTFTRSLPANTNISLRAYGHQSHRSKKDCSDTQLLVPFGAIKDNGAQIRQTSNGLKAQGYTPITHVLGLAADDLGKLDGKKTIILVSDGKETCEGDPCVLAKQLSEANIDLTIHTVGLGVDATTRNQLECIAKAGRGKYFDTVSASTLSKSMVVAVETKQKTVVVKVKSKIGEIHVPNSDFNEIADAKNGEKIGAVFYAGKKLKLPAGLYNVSFGGNLIVKSVEVVGGETTVVPTGTVKVQNGDRSFYNIFDQETHEKLTDLTGADKPKALPAGRYQIAFGHGNHLRTDFEIYEDQNTIIETGVLKIVGSKSSIKIVDPESGKTLLKYGNIDRKKALLPGAYILHFGSGNAPWPIEIKAGEDTVISPGGIKLTPPTRAEVLFPDGKLFDTHLSYNSPVQAPAGKYIVKIEGQEVPVDVVDGQIVEIKVE